MHTFNCRALAIPMVLMVIVVIGILVFALLRTGNDYYLASTSELKALQIDKFMSAFIEETLFNLDRIMNSDSPERFGTYREVLLKKFSLNADSDIKKEIFSKEFNSTYSHSLKETSEKLGFELASFITRDVSAEVISKKALPVPGWLKPDDIEGLFTLKISAAVTFMGVTRNRSEIIKLKIVRASLPVLSKFSLFVKNSYQETASNGYNIAHGMDGTLKYDTRDTGAFILDHGKELSIEKRGKIFLGGSKDPGERIFIKLVEESSVNDTKSGGNPFSNIAECGITGSIAYGKRGYNKAVDNGFVSLFFLGFGKYLTSKFILSQFTLDRLFFPNKFDSLKQECGLHELSLEHNNFDLCCPVLLFGANLNLTPTIVFGEVYRSYVRLGEYHIHGASGVLYYLAPGDSPDPPHYPAGTEERDRFIDINELSTEKAKSYFNALTRLKYHDYMSTVITEPYSADGKINREYSDEDIAGVNSGKLDLNAYDYALFQSGSSEHKTEWQKGLAARICLFYENENDFKKDFLENSELEVKYGIVQINGNLDLSRGREEERLDRIVNCRRCIIIVKGDLYLPEIRKKYDSSTVVFIAEPVYRNNLYQGGGHVRVTGGSVEASIISWLDQPGAIEFITVPCTLKGSLALSGLYLKNSFLKNKSIHLSYDPLLAGKGHHFSILPSKGPVW